MVKHIMIGCNERGDFVNEFRSNSKLTFHDAELIRELHEEHQLGYKKLAQKFEVSIRLIRQICAYKNYRQPPQRYKRITIEVSNG